MLQTYRCRTLKPQPSKWFEVQAESPEEAASEFHCDNLEQLPSVSFLHRFDDGECGLKMQIIKFSSVEVEGHEELVVRTYLVEGIWRRANGGSKYPPIDQVAKTLGWSKDPQELLSPDWDYEESLEEARAKKERNLVPNF